jgi:hypothetical protein
VVPQLTRSVGGEGGSHDNVMHESECGEDDEGDALDRSVGGEGGSHDNVMHENECGEGDEGDALDRSVGGEGGSHDNVMHENECGEGDEGDALDRSVGGEGGSHDNVMHESECGEGDESDDEIGGIGDALNRSDCGEGGSGDVMNGCGGDSVDLDESVGGKYGSVNITPVRIVKDLNGAYVVCHKKIKPIAHHLSKKTNCLTPMASATEMKVHQCLQQTDKFKKQKRKRGTYLVPTPGFLQAATSFPSLLKNGGRLNRVACKVTPGRLVQVNLSSTCTVDNVLMALAYNWHKDAVFRKQMESIEEDGDVRHIARAVRLVAQASNYDQAACGCFMLIDCTPALVAEKHLYSVTPGRVYFSMFESE